MEQQWQQLKQQTSLQAFNYDPNKPDTGMNRQLNRPSPSHSATTFAVGYKMKGNDGRMWQVTANSAGIQRWVPAGGNVPSTHTTSGPNYKFNVGDTVKVIAYGIGCGDEEVGLETTIVELGSYGGGAGYKVYPAVGNSKPGRGFNGYIGEASFELKRVSLDATIQQPITTIKKPLNMAKATKSITKKTTQEVRQIETSLINKEEVFKMLALAEATGLPLLLVGEPGVNSK